MSDIAIRVENLGKRYRIGERPSGYKTIRESLTAAASRSLRSLNKVFGRNGHQSNGTGPDDFWALRDVSFEVKRGEVVGVIGRNGAGKSTLLRILSRITDPTEGRAMVNGRVSSLLEVGTGFHPELTGRENIYLNGAVLGMTKNEITHNFNDIVAFADVARFLDTPVKRYSSGMQLRLAFAVAAHLQPEVLIIDEVLAVGDVVFQNKCLGKMNEVADTGRTILFVSHNLAAVRTLCARTLLLHQGALHYMGPTSTAISTYLSHDSANRSSSAVQLTHKPRVKGDKTVFLDHIRLTTLSGEATAAFLVWQPFKVEILMHSRQSTSVSCWLLFRAEDGTVVLSTFQYDSDQPLRLREQELRSTTVIIDPSPLTPGRYSITAGIFGPQRKFYDWIDNAICLQILPELSIGRSYDARLGQTTLKYTWQ